MRNIIQYYRSENMNLKCVLVGIDFGRCVKALVHFDDPLRSSVLLLSLVEGFIFVESEP